jgi:nucleotide-binding universal stress UspA family protein
MRILIAYDGSPYADAVLNDLPRAGFAGVHEALVLSVADVALLPEHAFGGPTLAEGVLREVRFKADQSYEKSREQAAKARDWLHELFPTWRVHALATAGEPADEILQKANDLPADVTVLGAHGHAPGLHLSIGSVSQKVLTHLRRTVRIARYGLERPEAEDTNRVIAAIDGSAHSQSVIEQISMRTWPRKTSVRVVTALDPRALPARLEGGDCAAAKDHAFTIATRAADALRGAGFNAFETVEQGDPRRVLLDAADTWKADCIFIGARGLTRSERFFLGSVSTSVAMRAKCTVEVVHRAAGTVQQ